MTVKKEGKASVDATITFLGVDPTIMFLTKEQVKQAVGDYMRRTMFKPEFGVEILSVAPDGTDLYRIEFCDPALLAIDEPPANE